jgi:large subunit ribosomal protein L30
MAEAKKAKSERGAAPKAAPKAKKPTAAQAAAAGPKVKVRLVRSGIGTPKDQRATLKGLGLSHLNQERELLDSAPLRGMLRKVRHLVSVDGKPAA